MIYCVKNKKDAWLHRMRKEMETSNKANAVKR